MGSSPTSWPVGCHVGLFSRREPRAHTCDAIGETRLSQKSPPSLARSQRTAAGLAPRRALLISPRRRGSLPFSWDLRFPEVILLLRRGHLPDSGFRGARVSERVAGERTCRFRRAGVETFVVRFPRRPRFFCRTGVEKNSVLPRVTS
jgi:hypothetical protein